MNQNALALYPNVRSRLTGWARRECLTLILAAVATGLLFNSVLGPKGPRDLLVLRRERVKLLQRRALLETRKAEIETLVQNLRSNSRYLERLIRRELGYARPDELVYKFAGDNLPPAEH